MGDDSLRPRVSEAVDVDDGDDEGERGNEVIVSREKKEGDGLRCKEGRATIGLGVHESL